MKSLTIRMRVTLWYACFMVVLIAISLIIISQLSRKAMLTNQKGNLIETVNDGIKEMDSLDNFDYFENGICLLIYDKSETYIEGIIPHGFSVSLPLRNDYIQTIESDNQNFYVYDKLTAKAGDAYWMRGVVPQSAPDLIGRLTVYFVSVFFPLLVVLTCVIGYFITKRAFRPVKKIQETAQKIADSDELFLRIGLPEGKDEIAKLGKTVDHMLDKLQRSFEKEKQFTSDVSHELRTPLAVMITESEYALQHATSLEEAQESIEVVNRQANKMTALINQLLFFARTDNGSLVLHNETFAVDPVISELVEDYRILAENYDISINFATTIPINVDKNLFIRCLSNVIRNAINYGNSKGAIHIKTSQKDNYLAIAVIDNGIGISQENLDKIWDRFYQVEESRSKLSGDSMGLGLAMVKMIVEKHGGYVTVDSVLDQGSTFTLYFPI